jgi:hypothetical protein
VEITQYGFGVTDHQDAKTATLAALRVWASTSRAELAAAAWHAGNRNLAELARAAGVGRQAIYQDLRKHNIDPPTGREEPTLNTTTNTTEATADYPVPGWRHPSLTNVRTAKNYGHVTFSYEVKVTATDPEPALPDEWRTIAAGETDWDTYKARQREIGWVRKAWAYARLLRLFKALYTPAGNYSDEKFLSGFMKERMSATHGYSSFYHPVGYTGTAGDVWRTYVQARDALAGAYEAMKTQPDNQWRAGLGAIVDATDPVHTAASNWDHVARAFMELAVWYESYNDAEYSHSPAEVLTKVAKELCLDVDGWTLADSSRDYTRDSYRPNTACQAIADIIDNGQAWLKKVGQLAGDR